MENFSSTPNGGKSPVTAPGQKLGAEMKNEVSGLAERASDAAKTLGEHATWALDDLKSAGREAVDEYGQKIARGRRQLEEAAGRISKYADKNTALIAGGSLVIGLLLGHILTRNND